MLIAKSFFTWLFCLSWCFLYQVVNNFAVVTRPNMPCCCEEYGVHVYRLFLSPGSTLRHESVGLESRTCQPETVAGMCTNEINIA